METDIIINDVHLPYHDKQVLLLVLKFIYKIQPTRLFINGDFLDCYEISRFDKEPFGHYSLRQELKLATAYLDQINTKLPKTNKIFIYGNHEYRFQRFMIKNAQQLMGLPGSTLKDQLQLKKMNYNVIDSGLCESYYDTKRGLLIGHFNKASIHSAYTAKALVEKYGQSIIQGHCHRTGIYYKTIHDKTLVGIENGCLCDLNPDYMLSPNWMHGFTIINWIDNTPHFTLIHIKNGKFVYNGKIYE